MTLTHVDLGIAPIEADEFPTRLRGRKQHLYYEALRDLKVGKGFKAPCRWRHHSDGSCTGSAWIVNISRRAGKRFAMRCREGTFYVLRLPDKKEQP